VERAEHEGRGGNTPRSNARVNGLMFSNSVGVRGVFGSCHAHSTQFSQNALNVFETQREHKLASFRRQSELKVFLVFRVGRANNGNASSERLVRVGIRARLFKEMLSLSWR
jgi:hypothetical protein